jgi:DNA-binding response OmpR family regulator
METTDLAPSDPVFAMLLARHVAIVGFEPEEDSRLSAVLSEAGALCHSFQAQALPLALRRCDIALVMVDELRPSRIETFSKPVVAAITANSLKYYSQWIRSSATDWFFCPATAEELLTRLTVVLQRQAGSVLDVEMPLMDGFEVLTALKSDVATTDIPVFMVTGSNQDSQILRGLRLGASDYVVKPFDPPAVMERIRQLRTHKFS